MTLALDVPDAHGSVERPRNDEAIACSAEDDRIHPCRVPVIAAEAAKCLRRADVPEKYCTVAAAGDERCVVTDSVSQLIN